MERTRELTYVQALNEALRAEMQKNESIFIMGEDIRKWGGAFAVSYSLFKEFGPNRVRDTPISEAAFMGAATGAAIMGLRPVVELMFNDFMGVCWDQIFNQAAKLRYMTGGQVKIPLVIITNYGGGVSAASHHSQSLYTLFAHCPGIKVAVPSTPRDGKGLLTSALRDENPVILFSHKLMFGMKGQVPEGQYSIDFGEAEVKKPGNDITVVAIGYMVHVALEASKKLAEKRINIEVIDPRTLVPFDKEAVFNSLKKTGKLIILDESYRRSGYSAEIASMMAEEGFDLLDAPIKRVTGPNTPIPFSPELERYVLPSEEKLIKAAEEMA